MTGTPANDASTAFWASAMALMDEYHREGTSEGRRREIEDELGGLLCSCLVISVLPMRSGMRTLFAGMSVLSFVLRSLLM